MITLTSVLNTWCDEGVLSVRIPIAFRNKCERVTGPQPERVRSIFAGVNATRTSGTGPERVYKGLFHTHFIIYLALSTTSALARISFG